MRTKKPVVTPSKRRLHTTTHNNHISTSTKRRQEGSIWQRRRECGHANSCDIVNMSTNTISLLRASAKGKMPSLIAILLTTELYGCPFSNNIRFYLIKIIPSGVYHKIDTVIPVKSDFV
jgi:hypothetical protein